MGLGATGLMLGPTGSALALGAADSGLTLGPTGSALALGATGSGPALATGLGAGVMLGIKTGGTSLGSCDNVDILVDTSGATLGAAAAVGITLET